MLNLQNPLGKYCDENLDEMVKMYKDQGMTLMQISEKFETTPDMISKKLKSKGVSVYKGLHHNKSLVKDYFEKIDTPDKAYFLGFSIADGSVSYGRYMRYRIALKRDDEYILETLKRYVNAKNEISHRVVKYDNPKYNNSSESTLCISCKEFVMPLSKYGVVPHKTFNTFLPILDKEMMPHLLRGLIDGDGWISAVNRSVGIIGSVRLMEDIRSYMTETLGVHFPKITQESRYDSRIGKITWNKISDVEKICNWLYQDKSDLYLKRKYENWLKIKNYFETRPFRIPAHNIRVRQYDKNGTFLKEFKNNVEASKELGIPKESILANCKKRYKSAGNYVFKFNPEDESLYINCNSEKNGVDKRKKFC